MSERDGYKVTEIGLIPKEWEPCILREISEFITKGATPTTYGFEWKNEGILFLKSDCITPQGFNYGQSKYISQEAHNQMKRSVVKPGDILMSITGYIGKVIITPNIFSEANINQHIARIRIVDLKHSSHFIYYSLILPQQTELLIKNSTGQAYPQLSLEQVRNIKIYTPPLSEQLKIADILSTVDAHISETEALIDKTQVLKKGMMNHLLTKGIGHSVFKETEIGRIPSEWIILPLKSIAKVITGKTPPTKNPDYWGGSIPWITPSDIYRHRDIYTSERQITFEGYVINSAQLPPNSILVTCIASIGKNAITRVQSSCNQQINAVLPNKSYNTEYLYYWISNNVEYYKSNASKTSVAILNKSNFENLHVVLPSLPEQNEIGSILSTIDDQIDIYQIKLASLTKLKSALMQQLLTGKIRVKV